MLTLDQLQREAAATGFAAEALEKVIRLLVLLEGLRSHPFLKTRLVLKGGTALNLFVFDVPRLSVDIDLNYIGAADRETMLAERPQFERAVEAVCSRLDLAVRRVPAEHAGGKWRLAYVAASGRSGRLELDANFLLRVPLWPPLRAASRCVGSFGAVDIPLLDLHELAAGKVVALLSRSAPRDLYDVRELLGHPGLDGQRLRVASVVYGGIGRRDWREVSLADVHADPGAVDRTLLPLLRADVVPRRDQLAEWTERLGRDCRELLRAIFPLGPDEIEFLRLLNERGEIRPELLTDNESLRAAIRAQPGLKWKAQNVRAHRGRRASPS